MADYSVTGNPISLSRGASSLIRVEFGLIQTTIATKVDKAGGTYTGAHNMTGATVTVAAPTTGSNPATKTYADGLAFATALPAQSLGFLVSTGTVASFSVTFTGFAVNEVKGADVASAGTINLTTATGNLVHVTGTTTITAITIPSGAERTVVFDGVLTLTHHATTLILPGGANITTAAGDSMVVRGDGSGNARVVSYTAADGSRRYDPGAAKAWIKCDAAGAIQASYNVTSITDNGTGDVTVTIATDFASADYAVVATVYGGGFFSASVFAQAAGSVQVKNWTTSGGLNPVADPTNYYIACFGTSV